MSAINQPSPAAQETTLADLSAAVLVEVEDIQAAMSDARYGNDPIFTSFIETRIAAGLSASTVGTDDVSVSWSAEKGVQVEPRIQRTGPQDGVGRVSGIDWAAPGLEIIRGFESPEEASAALTDPRMASDGQYRQLVGLMQAWTKDNGYQQRPSSAARQQSQPHGEQASAGLVPFRSQSEIMAAMAHPSYERDSAYRDDVAQRLYVTPSNIPQ
jgi:hypothetical protein